MPQVFKQYFTPTNQPTNLSNILSSNNEMIALFILSAFIAVANSLCGQPCQGGSPQCYMADGCGCLAYSGDSSKFEKFLRKGNYDECSVEQCGSTTCDVGDVCCNESCGICTAPVTFCFCTTSRMHITQKYKNITRVDRAHSNTANQQAIQ